MRREIALLHEKALARAKPGTGTPFDFSGTWANELKSTMVIKQQSNGSLSGTYVSAVSGGNGGTTTGDLLGYVDGSLISFLVHWQDFQAITAWVGQLVPQSAPAEISTLWQMTKAVDSGDEWASTNAGADTFTRR
jgi:avidin family protein